MNSKATMHTYLNDGTTAAPRLEIHLNLDTLRDLPPASSCAALSGEQQMQQLAKDGFQGVQVTHQEPLTYEAAMPHCGLDRVSVPGEADRIFARHADRGDRCLTLHVGWGTEDDAAADRLIEEILRASEAHALPAFIETHRATITQDMWRTVQLTRRFPEIRFNGDFSHYYSGQEMEYGDFEGKLDFMQPIFDRTAFLHGRIASRGSIQAPIEAIDQRPRHCTGQHEDYLENFKRIWTRVMAAFRRQAAPGDLLVFAPELLSAEYDYARRVPAADGRLVEESDRYAEALLYRDLARQCFAAGASPNHPKPQTSI